MLEEELEEKYGKSVPILIEEILRVYDECSRQYVFRLIKNAERKGKLVNFDRGVYYIPEETFFGASSISADQVAEKKYVRCMEDVYGVYSGLGLLNMFGVTTQVPNEIEIVTNNEATRKREVKISERSFILRKSRCKITKDNFAAYTVLQLFNDMGDDDELDESAIKRVQYFIKVNDVGCDQLIDMADYFPGKVAKRLMRSPVFYGAIRGQRTI